MGGILSEHSVVILTKFRFRLIFCSTILLWTPILLPPLLRLHC